MTALADMTYDQLLAEKKAAWSALQEFRGKKDSMTPEDEAKFDSAAARYDDAESAFENAEKRSQATKRREKMDELFDRDRHEIEKRGENRNPTYLDEARFILGFCRQQFQLEQQISIRGGSV